MTNISRRSLLMTTGGLMAAGSGLVGNAFASNHFETALVRNTPDLSIADMYVFANKAKDHTVFIIDVNFKPDPKSGSLYHDGALYNIHVSKNDEYTSGMTLSFSFDGSKGKAYLLDQPNADVGAIGAEIGALTVGEEAVFDNGIRVWTGLAKDPFFGNSPGIGVWRAQQAKGFYDPEVWTKASGTNIFAGRNCAPIVVEVPNSMLGDKEIRVFSTSAYKANDVWEQVQYVAWPLVPHSLLFESDLLKSAYARTRPTTQEEFRSVMTARIARSVAFADSQEDPFAYADKTVGLFIPNVQKYTPGTEAAFTIDTRNGRPLDDDAMSVIMSLVIGEPTDQAVKNMELYTDSFPYVLPVPA